MCRWFVRSIRRRNFPESVHLSLGKVAKELKLSAFLFGVWRKWKIELHGLIPRFMPLVVTPASELHDGFVSARGEIGQVLFPECVQLLIQSDEARFQNFLGWRRVDWLGENHVASESLAPERNLRESFVWFFGVQLGVHHSQIRRLLERFCPRVEIGDAWVKVRRQINQQASRIEAPAGRRACDIAACEVK